MPVATGRMGYHWLVRGNACDRPRLSSGACWQTAKKGIRVNGVAPGPVWTPLQPSGGQSTEKLVSFGADTPMGRPGQPAELAPLYVLLASAEPSYSSGQIFGAVGGRGRP